MIRPTDKVLRAILNLEHDPDFKLFMAWLSERAMTAAMQSTVTKDEVETRWKQGRVQELSDIAAHVTNARKNIEQMRESEIKDKTI